MALEVRCAGCNEYYPLEKIYKEGNGYYCHKCRRHINEERRARQREEVKCAVCNKVLTPYDTKVQDGGKSYCPVCYNKVPMTTTRGKNAREFTSGFIPPPGVTSVRDTVVECLYCGLFATPDSLKEDRRGKVLCPKCGRELPFRFRASTKGKKEGTANKNEDYSATAQLFKCLGDPCRVKIVELLSDHELCVFEFVDMLGFQYSAVSYHLKMLKEMGLVKSYERGNFMVYSLTDKGETVHEFIERSKGLS